jgi:hypothetical protein
MGRREGDESLLSFKLYSYHTVLLGILFPCSCCWVFILLLSGMDNGGSHNTYVSERRWHVCNRIESVMNGYAWFF